MQFSIAKIKLFQKKFAISASMHYLIDTEQSLSFRICFQRRKAFFCKMKLDGTIILALNRAADRLGGIVNLGRQLEISPSNISRYLSGKVQTVSDDNWSKIRKFLCPDFREQEIQDTPVIEWQELQQDPEVLQRNGTPEHLMLRVQGQQMAPLVCDRDLLVVRRTGTLKEIPENKIVVAVFKPLRRTPWKAVCKRLRKINGCCWLFSDEPGGLCFPAESENILWTGVVLRKICEL